MTARPTLVGLRSHSQDPPRPGQASPRGLLSPRMTHYDGDVPPAMSPLDAFAAQSRLLIKQLDESRKEDRRVSRLPPLTIANSLAKPRPGIPRSRSVEHEDDTLSFPIWQREAEASGNRTEVEEPEYRPKSFYPRMSRISQASERPEPITSAARDNTRLTTPSEIQTTIENGYFSIGRAISPEPVIVRKSLEGMERSPYMGTKRSIESTHRKTGSQNSLESIHRRTTSRQGTNESAYSRNNLYPNALAPLGSPALRHASSIKSVPADSSDDDYSESTGGSSFSQQRKLSSSSGLSLSQSPISFATVPHARSPSLNSEASAGGTRLPHPAFNFSRPLSRGRPSTDRPSRQPSSESQRLILSDDTTQTPVSIESEEHFDSRARQPPAAPSYIYTKFSLPRGRMIQKDSMALINMDVPLFEWERPAPQSIAPPETPPIEVSPLPQSPDLPRSSQSESTRPVAPQLKVDMPSKAASTKEDTPERSSSEQGPPPYRSARPGPTPIAEGRQHTASASINSGSTIKARSYNNRTDASTELTAEDHLAKGIQCHESGSLNESTYHLRIAAKQNNPTAMLLYALACRHGWGMRPNQREGVQWLRRAADSASLEVADDETLLNAGIPKDSADRRTRRAQFALSIYELGVSHMNGWGIEQDKILALRCFEIAGSWGDADAMAEAGFCYAQGQGCKKDLKKAAHFYRMAEAKGISMVGNSWIYKPKYAQDVEDRQSRSKPTTPEKKLRDKSRTRTIFGRRKSNAAPS